MSLAGRVDELGMYLRLARRLPGYLRARDSAAEGRERLARRLRERERNFLELAERAIYAHPASPYRPLLAAAGCELGDLRALVSADGVEAALRRLRAAGVYVRFEESKGREPIARGGLAYPVAPSDFDNPLRRPHLESRTSGSTGARTRNPVDLDYLAEQSPIRLALQEAQGIHRWPRATVRGGLPESSSFGGGLDAPRQGLRIERWFTPELDPPRPPALRFRLAQRFVGAVARLAGHPLPRPEPLRMADVVVVARWAAAATKRAGGAVVDCTPSLALRISLAAREARIDLAGTVFRAAGEPMTAAKMAGLRAVGARAVVDFPMSGLAGVGAGCTRPLGVNDQHLRRDHLAAVQATRRVGDTEVDALLLTTLLPGAPRVLLNVETDDYGVLEERDCGCPLHALGLTTHVRDVRSFKKLTAEGVTLVGSDMEEILERVLPQRFGGSPLDYQLAEEEDADGLTRVWIHVSPAVGEVDEAAVVATVLDGLARASLSADLAARLWNQAGAIGVRRVAPVLGGRGKLLPLHFARRHAAPAESAR
jgi:hypothetical protein